LLRRPATAELLAMTVIASDGANSARAWQSHFVRHSEKTV
jgi:hypothetical protein